MTRSSRIESLYDRLHQQRKKIYSQETFGDIIYAKVAEVKDLPEYKDMEEGEIYNLLMSDLRNRRAHSVNAHLTLLNELSDKPDDPFWSQYTYEEILNMADNGTKIPEEILQWAKAQANEDAVNYEVLGEDGTDSDILTGIDIDLSEERTVQTKKNVQKYSAIAENEKKLAEEMAKEIDDKNQDITNSKSDFENEQKASAQKIEKYTVELENLQQKVSDGEELSANEKLRYQALIGNINEENRQIVSKTKNLQNELTVLFDSIEDANGLISINNTLSNDLSSKTDAYDKDEVQSNSGVLPHTRRQVAFSDSDAVINAMGGTLTLRMSNLAQTLQDNTSLLYGINVKSANIISDINVVADQTNNITNSTSLIDTELTEPETKDDVEDTETKDITDNDETSISNDEENIQDNEDIENTDIAVGEESEITEDIPDIQNELDINEVANSEADSETLQTDITTVDNEEIPTQETMTETPNDIDTSSPDNEEVTEEPVEEPEKEQNESNTATETDRQEIEAEGNAAASTARQAETRSAMTAQEIAENQAMSEEHTARLKKTENEIKAYTTKTEQINAKAEEVNNKANKIITTTQAVTENNTANISQEQISELAGNLEQVNSETEKLDQEVVLYHAEISNKEEISKAESDALIANTEAMEQIKINELAETNANISANEIRAGKIAKAASKFTITKQIGALLMINPYTISVGLMLFTLGKAGELTCSIANRFVAIAHDNLITLGLDLNEVLAEIENTKNSSKSALNSVDQAEDTATDGLDEAESGLEESNTLSLEELTKLNEKPEEEEAANQPKTEGEIMAKNIAHPSFNKEEPRPDTFKETSKKDSIDNESTDIQQTTAKEMKITSKEIAMATSASETVQTNTPVVNNDIETQVESVRPEYLKNPLLYADIEEESEKYNPDVQSEDDKEVAIESSKTAAQQEIKDAVREIMQSSLSSMNKEEQQKDTDKDKKHKMFTQFEREKKDALRKTVQKISKARDAR